MQTLTIEKRTIENEAIDEPMSWESAVAYIQFQGKKPESISFRPIVLNNVGESQPDIHNAYTNNQFLDTRGLPRR
jgi:hypothetical protein